MVENCLIGSFLCKTFPCLTAAAESISEWSPPVDESDWQIFDSAFLRTLFMIILHYFGSVCQNSNSALDRGFDKTCPNMDFATRN